MTDTAFRIGHTLNTYKTNIWVYLCFLVVTACVYLLPSLAPFHIGTSYILLFFAMVLMSITVWKTQCISPKAALLLGCFLYLILFPISPITSNDTERYLWDGAVFLSGIDPYVTAPNNPALADLRKLWPTPEEHAKYPTLYPPGALILFSLSAKAGPVYGMWLWKAFATLAALLSLLITYKLLELKEILENYALFALSPLLLFETQIGGHLDIFSVLGIILALWCLEKNKIMTAGILIGLTATIKILPAVIVGPYLFYLTPRKAIKLFISSLMTWTGIYLIMIGLGFRPLGLLPTFFEKWRGGAPIYPYLEGLKNTINLSNSQFIVMISGLSIVGFSLSAYLASKKHIEVALMLTLSVPLLLSPVLFPWYFMVLIPLIALKPNMTVLASVSLAPLSYIVLNKWLSEGIWDQAGWPAHVLLLGIIGGLVFDLSTKSFRNSAAI